MTTKSDIGTAASMGQCSVSGQENSYVRYRVSQGEQAPLWLAASG